MHAHACSLCSESRNEGSQPPRSPILTSGGHLQYRAGFVCGIQETPGNSFERILKLSPGIRDRRNALRRCEENLRRYERRMTGKYRPCVIMDHRLVSLEEEDDTGTPVCVMGTFGNSSYQSLSRLVQHFVIPVHPNLTAPGGVHMHTNPEMENDCSWVIAFEFLSKRRIEGAWIPPRLDGHPPPPPVMYRFGYETMEELHRQCELRLEQWDELCSEDPGFALRCASEYRVCALLSQQSCQSAHFLLPQQARFNSSQSSIVRDTSLATMDAHVVFGRDRPLAFAPKLRPAVRDCGILFNRCSCRSLKKTSFKLVQSPRTSLCIHSHIVLVAHRVSLYVPSPIFSMIHHRYSQLNRAREATGVHTPRRNRHAPLTDTRIPANGVRLVFQYVAPSL